MLLLLCTRDTKNNKRQEDAKFFNYHYHIQDIKYVQHKERKHDLGLSENFYAPIRCRKVQNYKKKYYYFVLSLQV